MQKNPKLSYIVPGYTGHIPKAGQRPVDIEPEDPHGQIPGYCGYIKSIKPENIFANTYGNITYMINCEHYHQGQDVGPEQRYNSLTTSTYVDQSTITPKTAATLVGVTPHPPNYRERNPELNNIYFIFKLDRFYYFFMDVKILLYIF